MRIGVFICHCGNNIAGTVDVAKVAQEMGKLPGVVYSTDYMYTCSEPGQAEIKDAIAREGLNRVIVASCSPRMHELTFRRTIEKAGLNPYFLEMANIREHVSWIGENKELNTQKALDAVKMAYAKVMKDAPLYSSSFPVKKKVLVIGAGVAGMQAALDCADGGLDTVIVERSPSVGGMMSRLDKTFPTIDCSICILGPKMVDVGQHEKITLHTYSEIEEIKGYVGNYTVKIRKKATYVDWTKCTGCGACMEKCPAKNSYDYFNFGVAPTTAINIPFPQAIPKKAKIDADYCRKFTTGKCGVCSKICPTKAIDYDMKDEIITEEVGVIIAATGYGLLGLEKLPEYGGGRYPDVITGVQYERILNASGPTSGHIVRPSDHEEPRTVVFISCGGSRDRSIGVPYCSNFCCMYIAKQAILTKDHIPDSQSYVFYMDIRAPGKGYDEFTRRAQEDYGVRYIRGRVSRVYPKGKKDGGGVSTRCSAPRWRWRPTSSWLPRRRFRRRGPRNWPRSFTSLMIRTGLRGEPSEAEAGGDEHGRRLPRGLRAGAEGHPRVGRAGERGRGEGPLPPVEGYAPVRPGNRAGKQERLRRLPQVRDDMSLPGYQGGDSAGRQASGGRDRDGLRGMRCLHIHVSVRRHTASTLYR
jgi:heterodisulfide reductase subunit A